MYAQYEGCCVDFNQRPFQDRLALCEMIDAAKEISYRTLVKHVPTKILAAVFPSYSWDHSRGLRMKDDYAVSFYRSQFKGERCYFVCWSAIEFIFTSGPGGNHED